MRRKLELAARHDAPGGRLEAPGARRLGVALEGRVREKREPRAVERRPGRARTVVEVLRGVDLPARAHEPLAAVVLDALAGADEAARVGKIERPRDVLVRRDLHELRVERDAVGRREVPRPPRRQHVAVGEQVRVPEDLGVARGEPRGRRVAVDGGVGPRQRRRARGRVDVHALHAGDLREGPALGVVEEEQRRLAEELRVVLPVPQALDRVACFVDQFERRVRAAGDPDGRARRQVPQ